ncbi:MAG: hypothetical protein HQ474_06840 [Flammeovirgaceae bacterium]|nr:hypothetical protein [Flammeovirgaceae bacterium]
MPLIDLYILLNTYALANDYHKNILTSGLVYNNHIRKEGKAIIYFNYNQALIIKKQPLQDLS